MTGATTRERPAGSNKLLLIVAILTLVSVGATIGVSYLLVPEGRSFVVNVTTAFAAMVETAVGLLVAGSMLRRPGGGGAGGATTAILLGTVVAYAIAGFVTIGAYALLRGKDESPNWLWAALLVETTLVFLASGALWGTADAVAKAEAPALARRADHAAHGKLVRDAATKLRSVSPTDADAMLRADQIIKRLDALASALAHSHGGGVGSREGGMQHPADPAAEQDLADAARALAADSAQLAPGGDARPALERMAADVDRLRSAVDRLGLA